MEDYKLRIQEEKKELDEKIAKLYQFLKSDKIQELDGRNRSLLNDQLDAMLNYSSILNNRLIL